MAAFVEKIIAEGVEAVMKLGSKKLSSEAAEKAIREATEKAFKEGGEDAAEIAARDAARQLLKDSGEFTTEAVGKLSAWRRFMDSAKNKDGDVHQIGSFVMRHPVIAGGITIGGSTFAYSKATGTGVLDNTVGLAKWAFLSPENQEKNLVEGASHEVTDAAFGKGASDKVVDTVKKGLESGKDVVGAGVDMTRDGIAKAGQMAGEAKERIMGGGQPASQMSQGGNGYVIVSPDGQVYPMPQQYFQQPQQTGSGIMGALQQLSPVNMFTSLIGNMFGGGHGTTLAAAIPAAMLMFGNYGWMAKLAAVMLGSFAWKNAKQNQAREQYAQMGMRQGYGSLYGQPAQMPLLGQRDIDNGIGDITLQEERGYHRSR